MILKLRFVKLKRGGWVRDDEKRHRDHDIVASNEFDIEVTEENLESDVDVYELTVKEKE